MASPRLATAAGAVLGVLPRVGGRLRVNPAAGDLLLQTAPPAPADRPRLDVLLQQPGGIRRFGVVRVGMDGDLQPLPAQLSSTVALVVDSVGNVFTYTRPDSSTTRYTPPAGANNGLVATTAGGWTETQPDGLSYLYPAPTNQVAMLQAVQNRNGSLWTMTYDSTGTLLKSITDPPDV